VLFSKTGVTMKDTRSSRSMAAFFSAGVRLRKSTTYRFATKAPPFGEILTHIAGEGQGAERSI
jgi:hypothetical protein